VIVSSLVMAAVLAGTGTRLPVHDPCGKDLGTWLACNNPRAISYLSDLSYRDVGKALRGVQLTDGRLAFKGYRFLGKAPHMTPGTYVYLVKRSGTRGAIAWVEEGGTELSLPYCASSFPGSAYVLSGDVYTWEAVQPGHGVIEVMCAPDGWPKAAAQQGAEPDDRGMSRWGRARWLAPALSGRRNMTASWATCESEFESDGSLRDIYVRKADAKVWESVFAFLVAGGDSRFSIDSADAKLPRSAAEVFALRPRADPLLVVARDGIEYCCHFFSIEDVELDFLRGMSLERSGPRAEAIHS